jgi:hypothetical protein
MESGELSSINKNLLKLERRAKWPNCLIMEWDLLTRNILHQARIYTLSRKCNKILPTEATTLCKLQESSKFTSLLVLEASEITKLLPQDHMWSMSMWWRTPAISRTSKRNSICLANTFLILQESTSLTEIETSTSQTPKSWFTRVTSTSEWMIYLSKLFNKERNQHGILK